MPLGKVLILMGVILTIAGLFLAYGGRIPLLGKLPGDIRIQRENFSFYFPLASCLLISALLSLILWLFRR
ncbi:MAG: hypothetical protein A2X84_04885 [Desulfuromonadaceae bacterium GWC2_58_13]|nr:MAG: hypothetical protein A2X84_04885 [Desulfuromonadaceae bacterium GWC2_58_13]